MERRVTSHTEEEEMNQRRRLLGLARKGDEKAISQLFELYQVKVYTGETLKKSKTSFSKDPQPLNSEKKATSKTKKPPATQSKSFPSQTERITQSGHKSTKTSQKTQSRKTDTVTKTTKKKVSDRPPLAGRSSNKTVRKGKIDKTPVSQSKSRGAKPKKVATVKTPSKSDLSKAKKKAIRKK